MTTVGVDGCRFGWIAVTKRDDVLDYTLFRSANDLVQSHATARRIFIDMPIGLPWRDYPIRECETAARLALGYRRSSVFSVPCRRAVHASDITQARALNIAELGRSVSAQTWNICAKIAELDALLHAQVKRPSIREVHPELAFTQLNGGTPMRHSKKSVAGIKERVSLLKRYEPGASKLLRRVLKERLRKEVSADDIVDALVVYVVSAQPSTRLRSFPRAAKYDEQGNRMEIIYALPQ